MDNEDRFEDSSIEELMEQFKKRFRSKDETALEEFMTRKQTFSESDVQFCEEQIKLGRAAKSYMNERTMIAIIKDCYRN